MKGNILKRRILAFVLALSVILGTCGVNITVAEAKSTSKISVKATKKYLLEGFPLTAKMVRKVMKVTENGKAIKFSVPKKQLGKPIKPSKKRKKKVIGKVYGKSISVEAKVDYMTNLSWKKIDLVLTENEKFSIKNFKKHSIFMAKYQKSKDQKFENYSVKAADTVTADKTGKFPVTVFYRAKNGTFKCTVRIPVVPKQNTIATATPAKEPTPIPTDEPTAIPTDEPTVAPSEEPTQTPTATPTDEPTAIPTDEPTAAPSEEPTQTPTATPTDEPTAIPTDKPTAAPSEEPTPTPTATPSETPNIFANLTVVRKGEGNAMVNNTLCSFSEDTATEKVTKGNCTFNAINTNEYKFVRLVDAETDAILSTEPSCSIEVNEDRKVIAVFERVYSVTVHRVGGRGKVTFNGESLEFFNDTATYTVPAGRYDMAALPTDDYDVVCWKDKDGKEFSTLPEQNVSIVDDTEFTIEFADATKTVTVTYRHDNNQLILSEAVPFGETLTPPTRDLGRANQTFIGWLLGDTLYEGNATDSEFFNTDKQSLSDAIKALTSQKQNVELVAQYQVDFTPYHLVTVDDGGIITSYEGEVIEENQYKDGTHLWFDANIPEGKFFDHWENDKKVILSCKKEFDCYVHGPLSLRPIFSDVEVEKKPIVCFTGNEYEVYPDEHIVRLHMSAEIPEGYEKIEFGFLYTFESLSEEEMILGSVAKPRVDDEEFSDSGRADWTYDIRFTNENRWQNGDTVLVRPYLKVVSVEGTEDIYGEIVPIELKLTTSE